jgi:hypothetical protein
MVHRVCVVVRTSASSRSALDGSKMAGRAVANRSKPLTVETRRGPVEVVRQRWRSQRAGSRWHGNGWLAEPDTATGGKERPRAGRSARPRCSPRGKQPTWLVKAAARATAELES